MWSRVAAFSIVSMILWVAVAPAGTIGGGALTLYSDKDFQGTAITLRDASVNLRDSGLNDRVSSVKVDPGRRWYLCKNKKYRGGCIVVDRDVANLADVEFNDVISSVKPVD